MDKIKHKKLYGVYSLSGQYLLGAYKDTIISDALLESLSLEDREKYVLVELQVVTNE